MLPHRRTQPHGQAYRSLSWFSDDICDGMLPVRKLRANELHNSGGHRPINAGYCTRASRAALPQRLLDDTALRVPAQLHANTTQSAAAATAPCSRNESTPHGFKAQPRHRRTHRDLSLLSDDSCDGMLPVRPLVLNDLSERASTAAPHPRSAPLYGPGCPHETPARSTRSTTTHSPRVLPSRHNAAAWADLHVSQLVQR
jgi:hypothetical protein